MAVSLGTSKKTFDGTYCDIAANGNGDLVCVYHKSNVWNDAYYKTGKLTKREVQWFPDEDIQVCKAKYPRVAINDDKTVVMVYTIPSGLFRIATTMYRIGIPDKDNMLNWKKEHKVQYGYYPSVAVSGDKVLIVYIKWDTMHFCFGRIDVKKNCINWNVEHQELKAAAAYPSVAMQEERAVIIYKESAFLGSMFIGGNYLKSIVGDINNDTVRWKSVEDDSEGKGHEDQFMGEYPSISMFGDGIVVSTHQKWKATVRQLLARSGKIDSESGEIVWHEKAGNFVLGAESSVAAVSSRNDHIFIEMHTTNAFGSERLYYHIGTVS